MDYNYSYDVNSGALGALLAVYILIMIAIYVVTVVGLWKMFVKAGRPGWAAIVPIYNWWVWVEMIGRPRWWFWALVASLLLSWIPLVGIILSILMFVLYLMGCLDMAKAFGRGAGTGIGLWLVPFVFAPILGFGDAQYVGPVAAGSGRLRRRSAASAACRWLRGADGSAGSAGDAGRARPGRRTRRSGHAAGHAGSGRSGCSGDAADRFRSGCSGHAAGDAHRGRDARRPGRDAGNCGRGRSGRRVRGPGRRARRARRPTGAAGELAATAATADVEPDTHRPTRRAGAAERSPGPSPRVTPLAPCVCTSSRLRCSARRRPGTAVGTCTADGRRFPVDGRGQALPNQTNPLRLPLPTEPSKEGTPCDSRPQLWPAGSARRPWLTLALWAAALVAIVAVIVLVLPGTLTAQYSFLGQSRLAARSRPAAAAHGHAAEGQRGRHRALARRRRRPTRRSAPTCSALQKHIAALGPGVVDSAVSAYQGGDKTLISADGRTAIIPIVMAGDLTQAEKNIDKVHEVVHAADGKGGFDTLVTGAASINSDFSHTAETDLRKGEGIGVPIALVILLIVFGAVVAAGLPILLSLIAITMAVGLTALVGQTFDVSVFAINMVSMMGLATGIDYSLFIISRFREERARGRDKLDAIAVTGGTASRAVLFSGLTVVLALLGPADRADQHLRQPRDRRHPRGEHVGGRRADAAAGRAQPPRRPRQQPQGAVPRPAHPRQPRLRAHLLDRPRGLAGDEAAGDRPRRRRRRPAAAAPTPPST